MLLRWPAVQATAAYDGRGHRQPQPSGPGQELLHEDLAATAAVR